jgi:hypothetical protein
MAKVSQSARLNMGATAAGGGSGAGADDFAAGAAGAGFALASGCLPALGFDLSALMLDLDAGND